MSKIPESVKLKWQEKARLLFAKVSWPAMTSGQYYYWEGFTKALEFVLEVVDKVAERELDGETSTDQIRAAVLTCKMPSMTIEEFRRTRVLLADLGKCDTLGDGVEGPGLAYLDNSYWIGFSNGRWHTVTENETHMSLSLDELEQLLFDRYVRDAKETR